MATNQQRREAAKRKLERQIEHRQERVKRNRVIGAAVTAGAVVIVTGLVVFLATRGSDDSTAQADEQQPQEPSLQIPSERAPVPERTKPLPNPSKCAYKESPSPAAKDVDRPENGTVPARGTVDVAMETTAGPIGLTLDRSLAPCTVNSMVNLIKQDFYEGSECHRLGTRGLQMLQCGDPTGSGRGGPGYSFADETFPQLSYGRGLVAMANSGPDTNGSQFFLVYGEAQLDPNYTVFGTISDEGLATLDKVANGGIGEQGAAGDGTGKPEIPVKFTKVTVDA
ncbi:peptidylprolyl isomerase [Haloechinothrix halophila]|uniref:peptidylprolyl isomerase n=1 Tax=Haloechinothrix halophila TaxID=1069073 RepID=UPI00040C10E3|nr:peptidylprolyl isomerase [Haloechinothrix halophila]